MNVLIACEESQRACIEFRNLGINAFSADLKKCSGGYPEYHIKGDVLQLLNGNCSFTTQSGDFHYINGKWDLIIAHPPCTYLSKAGSCNLVKRSVNGRVIKDTSRLLNVYSARTFFYACLNADCDLICVENPVPMALAELPPFTQTIEPYYFGDPYTKLTCLWLKGLPPLVPTCIVEPSASFTSLHRSAAQRSKSFPGIARAMAQQWSNPAYIQLSMF